MSCADININLFGPESYARYCELSKQYDEAFCRMFTNFELGEDFDSQWLSLRESSDDAERAGMRLLLEAIDKTFRENESYFDEYKKSAIEWIGFLDSLEWQSNDASTTKLITKLLSQKMLLTNWFAMSRTLLQAMVLCA